MSETVDLSSEVHARCHEGRWFRRAKELERERDGALKLAGIRADALVKAERERDEARAERDEKEHERFVARNLAEMASALVEMQAAKMKASEAREAALREALEAHAPNHPLLTGLRVEVAPAEEK